MRRSPCERAGVLAASRARRTLGARGGAVRLVSLAPETPEATVSARNMQRALHAPHHCHDACTSSFCDTCVREQARARTRGARTPTAHTRASPPRPHHAARGQQHGQHCGAPRSSGLLMKIARISIIPTRPKSFFVGSNVATRACGELTRVWRRASLEALGDTGGAARAARRVN